MTVAVSKNINKLTGQDHPTRSQHRDAIDNTADFSKTPQDEPAPPPTLSSFSPQWPAAVKDNRSSSLVFRTAAPSLTDSAPSKTSAPAPVTSRSSSASTTTTNKKKRPDKSSSHIRAKKRPAGDGQPAPVKRIAVSCLLSSYPSPAVSAVPPTAANVYNSAVGRSPPSTPLIPPEEALLELHDIIPDSDGHPSLSMTAATPSVTLPSSTTPRTSMPHDSDTKEAAKGDDVILRSEPLTTAFSSAPPPASASTAPSSHADVPPGGNEQRWLPTASVSASEWTKDSTEQRDILQKSTLQPIREGSQARPLPTASSSPSSARHERRVTRSANQAQGVLEDRWLTFRQQAQTSRKRLQAGHECDDALIMFMLTHFSKACNIPFFPIDSLVLASGRQRILNSELKRAETFGRPHLLLPLHEPGHWSVATCYQGTLYLLDSMCNDPTVLLSERWRDLPARLGIPGAPVVRLPVQQQQDGCSCGFYVIDFAEQIVAKGWKPRPDEEMKIQRNPAMMRQRIAQLLEAGAALSSPTSTPPHLPCMVPSTVLPSQPGHTSSRTASPSEQETEFRWFIHIRQDNDRVQVLWFDDSKSWESLASLKTQVVVPGRLTEPSGRFLSIWRIDLETPGNSERKSRWLENSTGRLILSPCHAVPLVFLTLPPTKTPT